MKASHVKERKIVMIASIVCAAICGFFILLDLFVFSAVDDHLSFTNFIYNLHKSLVEGIATLCVIEFFIEIAFGIFLWYAIKKYFITAQKFAGYKALKTYSAGGLTALLLAVSSLEDKAGLVFFSIVFTIFLVECALLIVVALKYKALDYKIIAFDKSTMNKPIKVPDKDTIVTPIEFIAPEVVDDEDYEETENVEDVTDTTEEFDNEPTMVDSSVTITPVTEVAKVETSAEEVNKTENKEEHLKYKESADDIYSNHHKGYTSFNGTKKPTEYDVYEAKDFEFEPEEKVEKPTEEKVVAPVVDNGGFKGFEEEYEEPVEENVQVNAEVPAIDVEPEIAPVEEKVVEPAIEKKTAKKPKELKPWEKKAIEKAEAERLEKERLEQERLEKEKLEQEKLAEEKKKFEEGKLSAEEIKKAEEEAKQRALKALGIKNEVVATTDSFDEETDEDEDEIEESDEDIDVVNETLEEERIEIDDHDVNYKPAIYVGDEEQTDEDFATYMDEEEIGHVSENEEDLIMPKKNRPFDLRLRTANEKLKKRYSAVRNELESYGMSARNQRSRENYRLKTEMYARFTFKGKTLCINLGLDPDKFDQAQYGFTKTEKPGYEEIPMLMPVKSAKNVKSVIELITIMMKNAGVSKIANYKDTDYVAEFENTYSEFEGKGYGYMVEQTVTAEMVDVYRPIFAERIAIRIPLEGEEPKRLIKVALRLTDLNENFKDGATIDLQALKAKGLAPKNANYLAISANKSLSKRFFVTANEISPRAVKMICLTGGQAYILYRKGTLNNSL